MPSVFASPFENPFGAPVYTTDFTALGVLQPFLRDANDGWTLALNALASGGDFTAEARQLGRATAVQRATLKASGSLDRHDAEVSVQADSVNANARLRGGWGEASGWSGEVLAITNTGPYPLQLRAPVPLRVARDLRDRQ